MKNIIKRLLASVIAVSAFLSVVPTFAEETAEPIVDAASLAETENAVLKEKYAEEIALLSGIGILTDSNIKMTNSITRAEFLALVMKTIKMDSTTVESDEVVFYDVLSTNENYSAIMSAYKMGLVHGDDKGCFNPDSPIDAVAALKILVCALDYDFIADAKGGYPGGYIEAARDLGLSDGITIAGTADWRMAIIMIDNALNSSVSEISYTADGKVTVGTGGETVLKKYYNLERFAGIVEGTNLTLRMEGKAYDETALKINGVVYTGFTITPGDGDKLLGKKVTFYYNEETDRAFSVAEDEGSNKSVLVKDEDIAPGTTLTSFLYWNENDKEVKAVIERDANIFYNGKIETSLRDADLMPEEGSVELVDNDRDGKYEVVVIKDYETYVAKTSSFGVITSKYDNWTIDLNKSNDYILYRDGFDITSDYIGEWDILKVMPTKDKSAGVIQVSRLNGEGTIDRLKKEKDYNVAVIDGVEYKISKTYQKAIDEKNIFATEPLKGSRVRFIYDENNELYGIDTSISESFQYGFLVAATGNTDGWGEDDKPRVKIFCIYGDMKVFNCKDNLKIDGAKLSGDIKSKFLDGYGKFKPQLIRYKLNTNEEVTEIDKWTDSTATSYNPDEFSLDYGLYTGSWTVNTTFNTIQNNYKVSPIKNTHVFYVPADKRDDEGYMYYNMYGNLQYVSHATDIEIYDMVRYKPDLDFATISAIVIYERPEDVPDGSSIPFQWNSIQLRGNHGYPILVEEVEEVYDETKDDTVVRINGTEFARSGLVDFVGFFDNPSYNVDTTGIRYGAGYKRAEDLKAGDFIRIGYKNPLAANLEINRFYCFLNSDFYDDVDYKRVYFSESLEQSPSGTPEALGAMVVYGRLAYTSNEEIIVETANVAGDDIYYLALVTSAKVFTYSRTTGTITESPVNLLGEGNQVAVYFGSAVSASIIVQIVD